ncbi:pilus assembly protein TadE [Actinomyces naeslundii]|uniref:TadE/TadG family type IV pilus assembly protein n=1 Tax=Actinomyces naeslundii TaxID=1655 RepID=UPI00096DFA6D|nr:TadE/TadG family type IV pilus assembly protein [Actinomyces naeslundii]OMG11088.1 pilus assembly protein TadE [Actinomyces naeslundii]
MTAAACPARLASSPKHLFNRLRHDERGVLDIELIGFVPILVLVTMFLVQGFFAVSTVTSVSAAARDGARAAMLGHSPEQAAQEALPSWVRLESVSDGCGSGHCVQVTARVPIGIPSITSERVTVTRTAYFPEG